MQFCAADVITATVREAVVTASAVNERSRGRWIALSGRMPLLHRPFQSIYLLYGQMGTGSVRLGGSVAAVCGAGLEAASGAGSGALAAVETGSVRLGGSVAATEAVSPLLMVVVVRGARVPFPSDLDIALAVEFLKARAAALDRPLWSALAAALAAE
ncbi:unnamed protein product [Medioppia subpectinata]|uniref:Uncharacterized protein n=1 Tax=Medioppia subpectinata TaxID=1979941 RepID=A0A7R9Q083_9ACAR|nr:unnamed protein product [Medioppia subpectinata]CAG2107777.1 unnamed protein product [Medioppia subpectinata]